MLFPVRGRTCLRGWGVNTTVLACRRLCRYYPARDTLFGRHKTIKALDGVSFDLSAGRTLAVVGESGCGKSTLARLIAMIESPTAGHLSLPGAGGVKSMRKQIQLVFQDAYGSLNPRKKVGNILEEPLVINTRMHRAERRDNAIAMLTKVGLRPEHYSRYPHMFSGGQRQRIAVARALMLRPKVVVADEPVSALDISIQAQILNLLMALQDELNLAYLFISHDLSVVERICDDVMVMYLGRAVEQGRKQVIFQRPAHPYTQALLASTPYVEPGKRARRVLLKGEPPSPMHVPGGCAFHQRCPIATQRCRRERPELREVSGRHVACHFAEAELHD